jgi:hypothetical protein
LIQKNKVTRLSLSLKIDLSLKKKKKKKENVLKLLVTWEGMREHFHLSLSLEQPLVPGFHPGSL